MGSCLTDATPEGRARRAVRALTAMLRPERIPHQSLRALDSVEPLRPPCQKRLRLNFGPRTEIVKRALHRGAWELGRFLLECTGIARVWKWECWLLNDFEFDFRDTPFGHP
jgi:hypothetical protein